MGTSRRGDQLSAFLESGIYRFEACNAVFIDPVRILNRFYTRHRVSPSAYYSRSFQPKLPSPDRAHPRKRKRKEKKPHPLNAREQLADQRHQEARALLLKAHEALLKASDLLEVIGDVKSCAPSGGKSSAVELSFVELGRVWQAHLYEITLNFRRHQKLASEEGSTVSQSIKQKMVPIFNNLVSSEIADDVEAEFQGSRYLIPRESCFHMSDLGKIHNLIPVDQRCGFNLILIDPPWENRSAHQKSRYPTLPNRYFLSIPIKHLTHSDGALIALWVTNREKLRYFVEKELFPAWGVKYASTFYWLKVKPDGLTISDLDLFHHRPYECLILGYCHHRETDFEDLSEFRWVPGSQIIISIPGEYSRKPPVGELLKEYAPGSKPARCIELFAREMFSGWTSWGNEPLHFQESRYFVEQ